MGSSPSQTVAERWNELMGQADSSHGVHFCGSELECLYRFVPSKIYSLRVTKEWFPKGKVRALYQEKEGKTRVDKMKQ